MKKISGILAITSLFISISVYSETILLKNGNVIKAKVIDQNSKEITIKTGDGKVQKFTKNAILKVIYKDVDEKETQRIKQEEEQKLAEKNKAAEEKRLAEEARKNQGKEEKNKETPKESRHSRTGMALRSMVLPGWGQYKEDRTVPAIIYPSIIALSLFGAYEKNREYRNAVRDFNNLGSPYFVPAPSSAVLLNPTSAYLYNLSFENQREAVEKHKNARNKYLIGALLVYIVNIVDAAYFYDSASVSRGFILDYSPVARKSYQTEKVFETEYTFGYFFKF